MRILLLLFLLCSAIDTNCQILNSEDIYNNIVLLKEQQGNEERHGTGFVLSSQNIYYLVTAKHVADSLHTDIAEIYFRDSSSNAINYKLKDFILKDSYTKFNENSDFFIIQLNPFDSASRKILLKNSIDASHLANDRNSIDRRHDLVVFGYPIFDLEHFTPVTFKSNFSSSLMNIYMKDLPKPCFCYLLENPSMAGFSGGPVFIGVRDRTTTLFEKTLIIGIVTGTTYDKTGAKFAIITPTFHLFDLIKE